MFINKFFFSPLLGRPILERGGEMLTPTLFVATTIFINIVVGLHKREFLLGDIQYEKPNCFQNQSNLYGKVALSNGLLDSHKLFVEVGIPGEIQSCRLCQLFPSYYCNHTIDASFYSMSSNVESNMRILIGDGTEDFRFLLSRDQMSVYALTNESFCGRKLRVILMLNFNIHFPIDRDFLLVMYDSVKASDVVSCSLSLSRTNLCRITRFINYVEFQYTNCLFSQEENEFSLPTEGGHSVFYYGKHLTRVPKERSFCNESWYSILKRMEVARYCDPELLLYIRPKAWYETVSIYITSHLNGVRGREMWLLSNMLEKSCPLRESEIGLEDTLFYPLVEKLGERLVCQNMSNFTFHPEKGQNGTLPYYARNYREWYYKWFHYILEADDTMKVKASLLLTYPFLLTMIGLVSLGFTLYHVYFRKHKDSLSQYSYKPLDE